MLRVAEGEWLMPRNITLLAPLEIVGSAGENPTVLRAPDLQAGVPFPNAAFQVHAMGVQFNNLTFTKFINSSIYIEPRATNFSIGEGPIVVSGCVFLANYLPHAAGAAINAVDANVTIRDTLFKASTCCGPVGMLALYARYQLTQLASLGFTACRTIARALHLRCRQSGSGATEHVALCWGP